MGTWAAPDTADKARRLAEILSRPLASDEAGAALRGLVGDDDLNDRISDAFRPSERPGDVSDLVAARIEEWLGELGTFVVPWEAEAVSIMTSCVASVRTRHQATLEESVNAWSRRHGGP